jgi:Flp pilus assembly protein protease CpaA
LNTFELLNIIDIIRIIPLAIIFAYAAIQDYKTGEVTNKIWLYTLIGAPITLAEYILLAPNMLPLVIISAVTCIAIALALFRIRNGWGGADAKALITIALCYPLGPAYLAWLPLYPMLIFGVSSAIAVIAMILRKKQQIRFLPYVFIGLTVMAVI